MFAFATLDNASTANHSRLIEPLGIPGIHPPRGRECLLPVDGVSVPTVQPRLVRPG